jgi:hypothetical protein
VVAAKRVSSAQKLEQNIRKARNQIARSGLPGVIAVDFTVLLSAHNVLHLVHSAGEAAVVVDRPLVQGIANLGGRVRTWVQDDAEAAKNVLAAVGYARGRFAFPGPQGPQFGTVRRMIADSVTPVGEQAPEWVKEFVMKFNRVGVAPT